MIDIKNNKDLYCANEKSLIDSLNFAKSLPKTDLKKDIHFYWRVPRQFERKQALPIKSAIVNNSNCKIYLWSNVDLSKNLYLQPLLPFINLKIWNPMKELEESFLKDNLDFFKKHKIDDEMCWLGGDLFRLLCLYKYGGIYTDMDIVTLRDLSPLYPYNFLYQWGAAGTTDSEPTLSMNGAVMSFNAGNTNLKIMLENLLKIKPVQNTFCWGRDLYGISRQPETLVFPCVWFNTEWAFAIQFNGFKKEEHSAKLYDGAFTWHWHNKWDEPIEHGSKFSILEEIIDEKFMEL